MQQEIDTLRAKLDEATETIRQLKDLYSPKIIFPEEWRLSKAETIILSTLYKYKSGAPIPQALLHAAIGNETEPKIVQVYICKMRKKLTPFNIEIGLRWGMGYLLTPLSRQIITNALAKQEAA